MKKQLFTLLAICAIALQSSAQEITVEPVQLTLLTKKTATWCPPCGGWAWDTFENLLASNDEKAIVVAAHFSTSNDPLYNETAEQMIDAFEFFPGRPAFYTNMALISGSGEAVETTAADFVNTAYAQTPVAQTGIAATVDFTTDLLTIDTKTEFFQKGNGEYYLAAYLVDKEVIATQAGQGNDAVHKNVLRDELTGSTFGNVLVEGSVAVGTTFEQTFSMDVAADVDLDNMSFMTVIWKKNGDSYEFVNAYKTDEVTEAMPSSTESVFSAGSFQITPNVASHQTTIELVLDKDLNNVNLSLFDLKGQRIETIFSGNQVAGIHRFELDQPASAAGIYWVTLRVDGQSFSKKVVFRN